VTLRRWRNKLEPLRGGGNSAASFSRVVKKFAILFAAGVCLWSAAPFPRIAYAEDSDVPRLWERYSRLYVRQREGNEGPQNPSSGIQRLWERYAGKASFFAVREDVPGRCVGEDVALAVFMRNSAWKYRTRTYELYFSSSPALARSVYGLAIQSGDVDKAMRLDRFEKGVQGFHYSIAQVCAWIDTVLANDCAVHTDEERRLMRWLLDDGVVRIVDGKAVPGGTVDHVLGAAPGRKRSFEINLRHERLHVLWDEDVIFTGEYGQKWEAMSASEKREVRKSLPAYSQGNEAQLMEEWAIFQAENLPDNERKELVGL
jgi:hypothetical protein